MNSHATILEKEDKSLQTLRLGDGRLLSYAEYGDPAGKPTNDQHAEEPDAGTGENTVGVFHDVGSLPA